MLGSIHLEDSCAKNVPVTKRTENRRDEQHGHIGKAPFDLKMIEGPMQHHCTPTRNRQHHSYADNKFHYPEAIARAR